MMTAGLAGLPVVWSEDCLRHEPAGEVWLGVWEPGTEVPERATVLLAALAGAGAAVTGARPHADDALLAVHDAELVEHLATIWAQWEAGGYVRDYGRTRVVPYVFPTPGLLAGLPMRSPAATHGRAGRFCYDTMTLVGPGSWAAIRAAADAALTAADLVAGGSRLAYALCRPPGHHAGPAAYGGSCYLNNAAIAAQALRASGAGRVAVIDIDAHHGNGTQAIFYDRPDVYYGSLHVDPGAGWFPHYVGYAGERGAGDGAGANRNLPLAPGTGDDGWLAAIDVLCADVRDRGADAIVVSLGVDAAAADPESPLQVSADGYRRAGQLIGALGPVVAVQEGGYDLPSLGGLVTAALSGLAAAPARGIARDPAVRPDGARAAPAGPASGAEQDVNALLALAASVLWGSSDFGGGLMSRRLHPSAAVLISQAIALAGLVAALPFFAVPGGWYLPVAAVAGVLATLSLASFYRAMTDAPLSLVAPITAAGTCIPVLVGLARGEHLSALQAAGIGVTLIGVILACGPEFRGGHDGGVHLRRQAVIFAVLAAAGFGIAYTLLALAAGDGSLYGTLLLQRIGGLVVLAPIVLRGRILGEVRLTARRLAALAAIGVSDIVANGSYALAASRGNLAIAAVLASLYPVVTALLARGILAERLRPVQSMGVAAALGGVLMLSS